MGILQKIGQLYITAIERLLGDYNRPSSEDRRFAGLQAGAGAVGIAAQASGIHVEGMKPEEAIDFVALLQNKMKQTNGAVDNIERALGFLESSNKHLVKNIIDAAENPFAKSLLIDVVRGVGGVDSFDPTIDISPRWRQISQDHKTSFGESFAALIQAIGNKTVTIPKEILRSNFFENLPAYEDGIGGINSLEFDENGRVKISAEILKRIYRSDVWSQKLKDMPEIAVGYWKDGSSFSQAIEQFEQNLSQYPLEDSSVRRIFRKLTEEHGPTIPKEAFEKIIRMNADPSIFKAEISKLQKSLIAEEEERRKVSRESDAVVVEDFAPTLSKFFGGAEWVERGDCLEATIPYDAGSNRAFLAMVDLLKEAGARENELPTFENTLFRRSTNGEKANYPADVPVPTFKVLSIQKHHVTALARLMTSYGMLNIHPDNAEETLLRRASLLGDMRELGVANRKTETTDFNGVGLS